MVKTVLNTFWATLGKIGLLFIPKSGHNASRHHVFDENLSAVILHTTRCPLKTVEIEKAGVRSTLQNLSRWSLKCPSNKSFVDQDNRHSASFKRLP